MPLKVPASFAIAAERLPLSESRIQCAGTEVRLFSVPYSPEMLDRVARLRGLKEKDWPYWLEDWPATYALAEWLAENPPPAAASPILDLGCGTGFLAAFLRVRLGVDVFSCDFNYDACRLAAINVGAAAGTVTGDSGARVAGPAPAGPRVFCADFSAFPSRARFGLVLGGEMLYSESNHAPILAFLKAHLVPGGVACFADPGRSAASGFALTAAAGGFRVETRRMASQAARRNVHVYKLTAALAPRA